MLILILPAPLSSDVEYVSGLRTEWGLKWSMYREVMSMLADMSDFLTIVRFVVFLVIKLLSQPFDLLASLLYGASGDQNE